MEKKDRLLQNARLLRKQMTKEERHLWYDFLTSLPVTVNRQKALGNYIVDFFIASAKIAIELDGSQHFYRKTRFKRSKTRRLAEGTRHHGFTIHEFTDQQAVQRSLRGYREPHSIAYGMTSSSPLRGASPPYRGRSLCVREPKSLPLPQHGEGAEERGG